MKILARAFYERDTLTVARALIGKIVVRQYKDHLLTGMIVETEAYTGDDPASHAFRGKTHRTRALFGPAGHAYIYFTYGNHYCLNIVAHTGTMAGGVLMRALEPLQGIEMMQKNRQIHSLIALTNGPGKLTEALHITNAEYGIDVTQKGPLYVIDHKTDGAIIATSRIGISKAKDYLWRFCLKDSAYLSKKIK